MVREGIELVREATLRAWEGFGEPEAGSPPLAMPLAQKAAFVAMRMQQRKIDIILFIRMVFGMA